MRTERIFRMIVRIFLFLLASSMSLVSFLGGYSAALVLTNEDNIDIDVSTDGDPFKDFNEFSIDIEFTINNLGYFDLEDLEVEIELDFVFDWVNKTGDGLNVTTEVKLFEGEKEFKTTPAGEKKKHSLSIEADDLDINATYFQIIATNADRYRDPIFEFEAEEIVIRGKYSLGLISFEAHLEDYNLGEFEEEV